MGVPLPPPHELEPARPGISPSCSAQGRACWLEGKEDSRDFQELVKALQGLDLRPEELAGVWAVLAAILQLGNICFSSSEVGSSAHQRCPHQGRAGVGRVVL